MNLILKGLSGLLALGVVGGLGPALDHSPTVRKPARSESCAQAASLILWDLGITPTALSVVGASDQTVAAVVGTALTYCESNRGAIAALAGERASLAGEIQRLEELVRGGGADDSVRLQLTELRSDLENVEASTDTYAALVEAAISSSLTEVQRDQLAVMSDARHSDLPAPFRVAEQSDQERILWRSESARDDVADDSDILVARLQLDARFEDVAEEWRAALGE